MTQPPGGGRQPGDGMRPGDPSAPEGGDPLVAGNFNDWFGKIVDALSRSWKRLFVLQAILAVPVAVTGALAAYSVETDLSTMMTGLQKGADITVAHPGALAASAVLAIVFALGLGAVVQVAAFWLIVTEAADRRPSLPDSLRFGLTRALALIGWEIVVGLLIVVGLIVIVPGVYFAIVLLPTVVGVVTVERGGVRACFHLARGRFFALLGRCAVALLFILAYGQIEALVIKLLFGPDPSPWAGQIVSGLLDVPLQVVAAAFLVITYAELRGRRGPTTTQSLAAQLDGARAGAW